jgi:uncharacterized membrane protein YgdD (TMEM256/DUF423 family)
MRSVFITLGSVCAFLGVACGAFGTHALKATLTPDALAIYQTGVNYQMWHSLGLLAVGLIQHNLPESKPVAWAGWLMFLGILLFSGSLYLLVLLDSPRFGMVTPVGGICFLLAWLILSISVNNKKEPTQRYE